MAIGSTRRTNGLKIPPEWEKEFREKNPIEIRLAKGQILFNKLGRAIQKMKDKEAVEKEGQTCGRSAERG